MAGELKSRRLLHSAFAFLGGVLYEGHHTVGHEATTPHGVAGPGHRRDLDGATLGRDLDAPFDPRGSDLEAFDPAFVLC